MANEVRITTGLQIKKGQLQYQSQPQTVTADMQGSLGPTPGALQVTTSGVDVNLSQLHQQGGWCRIMNLENESTVGTGSINNNYIQYGPKSGGVLINFAWLFPGEESVFRIDPAMGTMRIKAAHATANVLVEAFDY
jgi:hypothetical protein